MLSGTSLTTQKWHLAIFQSRDVMAAKPDFPSTGPLNPTNQLQEGTFPCAGMTGQKRHLTRLHMERHALQRLPPTDDSIHI